MCSRRLVLLLALVLLVGLGTRAFAQNFADVEGTPYKDAFAYLSSKSIVKGYPDGSGRPDEPLNRVEAVKVILAARSEYQKRVDWYEDNLPPLPLFIDTDQSAWYAPYIEAAYEQSIVTGYPDSTFRPSQFLNVEEAVALLMRSFHEKGTAGSALLSTSIENHDTQWYTPYVNRAIERNIVREQRMLRLGTPITRGQFFDMVYRLHMIDARKLAAFPGPSTRREEVAARPTGGTVTRPQVYVPTTTAVSNPNGSEQYFAISMPSLGVKDLTITHPEDPFSTEGILAPLQFGVGHLFSFPGAGGKVMVYGHSSGYPWDVSQFTKVFRQVNKLSVGDRIYVTYSGTLYTYEVSHKQTVDASDTSPFQEDGSGEELILYTCWPPDSIQQRYLVHAIPVDTVALR